MPRAFPLLPGQYYHIYNRGNNRENIFIEERNYTYFLKLYAAHIEAVADTYAYVLLRNHFHLLVRIKAESELHPDKQIADEEIPTHASRAFQALFTAYAKTINNTYGRTGKLFQEHFGRIRVTNDRYFTNLIFYIHFNPQKHGFIDDFRAWPWSSYHTFLSNQPTKLKRDTVLEWFDGIAYFQNFHKNAASEKEILHLISEDFD